MWPHDPNWHSFLNPLLGLIQEAPQSETLAPNLTVTLAQTLVLQCFFLNVCHIKPQGSHGWKKVSTAIYPIWSTMNFTGDNVIVLRTLFLHLPALHGCLCNRRVLG